MLHITISSLIFGNSEADPLLPDVTLSLTKERLTGREILVRAVNEQLHALNALQLEQAEIHQRLQRQYLDQHDITSQSDSGKIALKKPANTVTPDPNKELDRVIRSFNKKRFKMFVNDNEVSRLDDTYTLTEETKVVFIRLIPLAGG